MRLLKLGVSGIVILLASCSRSPETGGAVVADDWGRAIALAPAPRRVVSLAPATTELVFALGAGERLVGRTTWCDFPSAALLVPDLGNGIGPNVEAIAAARPDLVLVYPSEANRSAVSQLAGLGIRSAVVRQDAIADWRATARRVAQLLGSEAAAESLLADFDRRLQAVTVPARAGAPRVFIAVGANPPIAIGGGSFVSELVTLAGGQNAFSDITAPSAVVSLEAVVARNPDLILVLGPASAAATVAARPGWNAIPAVRSGRVLTVDGGEFNRPSPRLPEAVAQLALLLAGALAR